VPTSQREAPQLHAPAHGVGAGLHGHAHGEGRGPYAHGEGMRLHEHAAHGGPMGPHAGHAHVHGEGMEPHAAAHGGAMETRRSPPSPFAALGSGPSGRAHAPTRPQRGVDCAVQTVGEWGVEEEEEEGSGNSDAAALRDNRRRMLQQQPDGGTLAALAALEALRMKSSAPQHAAAGRAAERLAADKGGAGVAAADQIRGRAGAARGGSVAFEPEREGLEEASRRLTEEAESHAAKARQLQEAAAAAAAAVAEAERSEAERAEREQQLVEEREVRAA